MMTSQSIFAGKSALKINHAKAAGQYVEIEGERFYKISDFDTMPLFFQSIVSDSDHWLFISSKGGLTAGRKNPDNAYFPYATDDKIHDASWNTGSRTVMVVENHYQKFLWEPFGDNYKGIYTIRRNVYKNISGNKLIFEEINDDLQLTFQYAWLNSQRFGFVKKSSIIHSGTKPVFINILDGIQNILPAGVSRFMQNTSSTLIDAYKKNELLAQQGIAIYSLSSIPVDRAEPSESLKSTLVWSYGQFESKKILLSSSQLNAFRAGKDIEQEEDIRALPGAYFINAAFELDEKKQWLTLLDGNKDISDIVALQHWINHSESIASEIEDDIALGTHNLIKIVANADGLQVTGDELSSSRHFSNVLFNVMRGGLFNNHYAVEKSDFFLFFKNSNSPLFARHAKTIDALPATFQYPDLMATAIQSGDHDFERVCYEYLPLTFSRRHGDPSRPWNTFSIDIRQEDGTKILNYQGNWRDIFQNWEALSLSFPEFIESMVCKFVNASTADGYNPYRLTRNGFEWELLDLEDPWSQIGYWGDHQIIYLLKLLEVSHASHPGKLDIFLGKSVFSYANVPYRIKPYHDLLADPQNTILFDQSRHDLTQERKKAIGSDGQLVWTKEGTIVLVNLTEKLLLTVLTKLSNFIPEAGIWMNTQRPEWNDANNALVGDGVSMVTLYYLRRFMVFFRQLLENSSHDQLSISTEVAEFFNTIFTALKDHYHLLAHSLSPMQRKQILDLLGMAGELYREKIYANYFTGDQKEINTLELIDFCKLSIDYFDHSIQANQRDDHLYHAYNLMVRQENGIGLRYFYEMLEGQVALISSGYLGAEQTLNVLKAMKQSKLFRKDQQSYLLYPDRQLPLFIEKNTIPEHDVKQSALLTKLVEDGNRQIIIKDIDNHYHFNPDFRNAALLKLALNNLKNSEYAGLAQAEMQQICEIYETVFNHTAFTGRSGTFYKYEGLGCIYWHMVAKLLPAIKEIYFKAVKSGEDSQTVKGLFDAYYDIREGLGVHKSPQLYGAFPTDPYSHTPGHLGVQQPGMTGQVKEDIISRFGELGVLVHNGKITFNPHLLKKSEFLTVSKSFIYFDIDGIQQTLILDKNMLAFTYCQIPVIYHLSSVNQVILTRTDTTIILLSNLELDFQITHDIFNRSKVISRIDVYLEPIY